MKKLILLTFATPFLSYGQLTTAGITNNFYGNSSSGTSFNQWKSVGIGDFQFFLQPPASRLHINELYLGAPITPNPLGNLFRTDGSNDVMNQWELFSGDIDVTSRKFRIYTNKNVNETTGLITKRSGYAFDNRSPEFLQIKPETIVNGLMTRII